MSVAREILGRIMLQYPGMKIGLSWPYVLRSGAQACVGEEGEEQGAREKTKLSTKYRPLNV